MFAFESNQFLGGSEKNTLLFHLAKENVTLRRIKNNSLGRAEEGTVIFTCFVCLLETLFCVQSYIFMPQMACLQSSLNFFFFLINPFAMDISSNFFTFSFNLHLSPYRYDLFPLSLKVPSAASLLWVSMNLQKQLLSRFWPVFCSSLLAIPFDFSWDERSLSSKVLRAEVVRQLFSSDMDPF